MTPSAPAQDHAARRRSQRRGMTLPELLLAILGTSFVALASVTMLVAATYGTDEDKSVRSLTVEAKALSTRLAAAVRGSRALLDATATRAILWTGDADADGLVDTGELRVIDHDPAADRLTSSSIADSATPAEYDAVATDFAAVVAALDTDGHLDSTVWSNRVDTFSLDADDPTDAQGAELIVFTLGLINGDFAESVTHSVAPRNR